LGQYPIHGLPGRIAQNTKGFVQKAEVHHGLDAKAYKVSKKLAVFNANDDLPETVLLDEHDYQRPKDLLGRVFAFAALL
jgi:hypothetical protein